MHLMVSPDLQPNHFIFQGHCERFNPNVNPKSSDSDLRFSNGIHSVLFPLHFKSFIVLIFPLPLFSLHLFSLPAYTSAFLVVPYGLWFADSAARQRSWKVTWDKSCFSALRADIFQLCSALLPSDSPNMLAGGLEGGEEGEGAQEGWRMVLSDSMSRSGCGENNFTMWRSCGRAWCAGIQFLLSLFDYS